MPNIAYIEKKFSGEHLLIIKQANSIIEDYQAQGFKLTLRQLYYQFVSRDLLPNTPKSYSRLGGIINDARLAGRIDWDAIEDRTRAVKEVAHWENPAEIISEDSGVFRIDKWQNQEYRPEVWIEKEALSGVIQGVCRELDIPFLSCRGYTSQSEMWSSARRMIDFIDAGQRPIILHFGDHDPSGIDMSRDIKDRMTVFGCDVEIDDGDGNMGFRRLALNMNQIEHYNPPPNPAKVTDSRFDDYQRRFGDESWELDALEPRLIVSLIRSTVEELRDPAKWQKMVKLEKEHRELLKKTSDRWDDIRALLKGKKKGKSKRR